MIKKILIAVVVLVGAFLIYVALQPSEMNIAREINIKAPVEKVFPYINNSEKADQWMPWKKSDPGVKMVFSGPAEGIGSTTRWDSAGQMGTGEALVIDSVPNKLVKTQLTYTKPMQMTQVAQISLYTTEEGTMVHWTVTGKNTFVGKIFCVLMNMDKMVGRQFEDGLSTLKTMLEEPE